MNLMSRAQYSEAQSAFRAYADAMIEGKDPEFFKCEPGGAQSTRDMNLILQIRLGKPPAEAAKAAAKVVLDHHK